MTPAKRKTIKHFHDSGDIHELTFSCYQRRPLLNNNAWRSKLSECINTAHDEVGGLLAAFVYMPEHLHLLVWGLRTTEDVSRLLGRIKQPMSSSVHADLERCRSPLLRRLTVRERPGKFTFRYWQEGPGCDRNLFNVQAVQGAIDYIHRNPVERKLCVQATDWRWSSAQFYASEGQIVDPLLPKITPLPAEFWLGE